MATDRVLRGLDLSLALLGLVVVFPLLALVTLVGLFDTGSPIFRQQRVGRHQRPFALYKFRTMRPGTPSVATHLAEAAAITPLGGFLRRTKLDELPQLWNVLKGDMSLVGPRPCLLSQSELIIARAAKHVFDARPGITGLAQIEGIDMSTPELLADTDARMLANLNALSYLKYLVQTVSGKGRGDRVRGLHGKN